MSKQAMEDILIKLKNISKLNMEDFTSSESYSLTEDDCLMVETFIVQFKTLETKLETAELNRENLRDYLLKDYDMSNSFIDGVNDVIDNRTDNPSDELRDVEYRLDELESRIDYTATTEDVDDKIDDALADLTISRG